MERFCRECAAPLAGRSDKQFCSDDCRTAYHNRQYRQEMAHITQTNTILRRNRRILSMVFAAGIRAIRLTDRRLSGFDKGCYTAVRKQFLRREEYFCYEVSYKLSGGRLCHLTRHGKDPVPTSARARGSA